MYKGFSISYIHQVFNLLNFRFIKRNPIARTTTQTSVKVDEDLNDITMHYTTSICSE